jgi:hypothetical protein
MLQCVSLCMAVLAAVPSKPAPAKPAAPASASKIAAAKSADVNNGVFPEAATGEYSGAVKTIYTAANAPKTPALTDLKETDTISQYGITWKLDKKVRVGQFITGDWYFVGKATVVEITPKPLFGKEVTDSPDWKLVNDNAVKEDNYKDKWARNGSMLNPGITAPVYIGFDSRAADGYYSPALFTSLPIKMGPGDFLVSTISAPEPINHFGHGQPVLVAAVLTCLKEPVPADAFRPSYCDREQKIYLARNLKRELLYTLSKPPQAPPNLAGGWHRVFQRPWLDTVAWGYSSPKENMPRYGQWITHAVSHASMLLHLDYTAEDKEPLLVHYVQYGIDLWGIVRAGHAGWQGHGGFGQGRKWSIMFAGLMLGDADMQSPNAKYPKTMFGEDTQTAWGKSWTDANVVFTSHPIWRPQAPELKNLADVFGTKEADGWMQSEGYRRCCTSKEWPGEALAARLMRAEKAWNHDPFFAYVDRWMTEDNHKTTQEIDKVFKSHNETWKYGNYGFWGTQPNTDEFSLVLWSKYRDNLPPALGGAATTRKANGAKKE